MEVPAPPLAGGAVAAAPGRLGGPHPGPRAGGRGRLLLFGCGSPRRSHGTARPGPCRRLGRRGRAARYGTRSLPGRAVRSKPWGSIRGGREPQGRRPRLRPIRAPPSGRPSRPGCSDGGHRRSAIADQDRVGAGGPPGSTRARAALAPVAHDAVRASRLNAGAGGPVDAAARGAVATPVPFAPSVSARARAVRWRNDPATQKGGRRGSFTLRPALLPSRSGAMTPFLMSAGAAAHPKVTRRPPFSAPPTHPGRCSGPRRGHWPEAAPVARVPSGVWPGPPPMPELSDAAVLVAEPPDVVDTVYCVPSVSPSTVV